MEEEDHSLAGDLDGEEDSRFLRRQRAVVVRRSRFSRRLRRLAVALLVLLPGGTLGVFLTLFALNSPLFMLTTAEDILVDGNRYVTREEVLNALGLPPPTLARASVNIFRLSLSEKRSQVELIPWVRSATLARTYPHRLVVHIVERDPIAFVNVGGRLKLVDGEGTMLEKPERADFDFPVLTGLDSTVGLTERKVRLALYQDFEGQVAREASHAGWLISEVNLSDPDDLKALVVQGTETMQLYFGDREFLERFRSFLALFPELHKKSATIESVDLRYKNQIVVNPRPAAPETPPRPVARKKRGRLGVN